MEIDGTTNDNHSVIGSVIGSEASDMENALLNPGSKKVDQKGTKEK